MKKREWLSALSAVGGVSCLWLLPGVTAETGRTFVWLPLLLLCFGACRCFWRETDRRAQVCFGLLGGLFMLSVALNMRLEAMDRTGWDGLVLCMLAGVFFAPSAGEGFLWLWRGLEKLKKPLVLSPRKAFWLSFGVMSLCWLPVLLAYFPGITGYDIDGQAYQVYTGQYSTHHPLLHTLFLQLFMELGKWLWQDYSLGYGLYTITQYVLLALSMAYSMRWLSTIHVPRVLWVGTLILFSLSPQHMVMASTGTKDVLFAAVMLVLTVELYRFFTEEGRSTKPAVWISNVLLIASSCMLRNNTIYGLAFFLLLGVVFWRKRLGKQILTLLVAGMMVGAAGTAGLKAATNATGGSVREMLCVPCQQLARVYHLYGLDVPMGYEAQEVMPFVEDYTPERADAVKRQARVTTPDRLIRFVKLWGREAFHFPIEYIDAFLLNCKAYWALDDVSFATTYNEGGCMIPQHNPATKINMQNLWPQVKAVCQRLFTDNQYQCFPVLWTLIHPAFYTWLLGFVLAGAAYRRSKVVLICAGIQGAYLLTLLLGPCALIRYAYNLMLCMPVLLAALPAAGKEFHHE